MKVIIIGAGGHGRVVLDILLAAKEHEVIGFVDSNPKLLGRRVDGMSVLGSIDDLPALRDAGAAGAIVAIGDNGIRRDFARRVEDAGMDLIGAIHPSARLARNVIMGRNVVVASGAIVCAHSQIGDSAILNTGCIIDHECMVGTAAHVCPGARLAGHVSVEAGAFIGIGATIVQNVRIGCESVVGAGAVVLEDVAPMTTVVGVPAREIKSVPDADELDRLIRHRVTGARSPLGAIAVRAARTSRR